MEVEYLPQPGGFFVAAGDEYKDVIIIQAYTNKEDNGRLYGAYRDRETSRFVSKPIEEFSKPLFPFFSTFGKPREQLDKQYKLYLGIRDIVLDYLEGKNNFSSKIEDIEQHLTVDHGKEETDVQTILKVFIADTLIFKFKIL